MNFICFDAADNSTITMLIRLGWIQVACRTGAIFLQAEANAKTITPVLQARIQGNVERVTERLKLDKRLIQCGTSPRPRQRLTSP